MFLLHQVIWCKVYVCSILISNSPMDLLFRISLIDFILLLRRRNLSELNHLFWQCFDSCLQQCLRFRSWKQPWWNILLVRYLSLVVNFWYVQEVLSSYVFVFCVLYMHFTKILGFGLYFQYSTTRYFLLMLNYTNSA